MSETQRIMSKADAVESVTDSLGRIIEVRRVSRREAMRLMRQWGGAACGVDLWLGNAMIAACARTIAGIFSAGPLIRYFSILGNSFLQVSG